MRGESPSFLAFVPGVWHFRALVRVCAPARSAFSSLSLSLSPYMYPSVSCSHSIWPPPLTHTHTLPRTHPCLCPKFTPGDMGTMPPWAQAARRTKYFLRYSRCTSWAGRGESACKSKPGASTRSFLHRVGQQIRSRSRPERAVFPRACSRRT